MAAEGVWMPKYFHPSFEIQFLLQLGILVYAATYVFIVLIDKQRQIISNQF